MILHIDMDAFYASVEQLDQPELRGKCIIVGGTTHRGVVSAANYEARKYGIRSAMPIYQAKQKCPDGIFVRPRMQRYKEVSQNIMAILVNITPIVEPVSIDEAYMDITGCEKLYGNPEQIGKHIKHKIQETMNLTCSVGIAPNKFLAKIASDLDKPDGLTIIMPEMVAEFIDNLSIQKVPGVGQKTNSLLALLGVKTLGDVKKFPEKMILDRLGKYGKRLLRLAVGIDDSAVEPAGRHKSVSSEHTLMEDTRNINLLHQHLLRHAEDVAQQLRKLEVRARTITLKLKHSDFKQVTRSKTLTIPIKSSDKIFLEASQLLAKYSPTKQVRLIGVGASGLVPTAMPVQLNLFENRKKQDYNWEKVDQTMDSITDRFGKDAIRRAILRKNDKKLSQRAQIPPIGKKGDFETGSKSILR